MEREERGTKMTKYNKGKRSERVRRGFAKMVELKRGRAREEK